MSAYYNEIDPYAAEWLQNLILLGVIAPGDVDTRSIVDVRPDDLRGYTQCHFFAGIGVWSYALRLAGWSDDRAIWTASCPCQPFSAAGAGGGFADERHLWPFFHHLVAECRPAVLAGEQVASKDADPWLDLVQDDLEALDYAFGAVAFPSAGVGAPHIRDRTYWTAHRVADAESVRRQRQRVRTGGGLPAFGTADIGGAGGLGHAHHHQGLEGFGRGHQAQGGRVGAVRPAAAPGESGRLADTQCARVRGQSGSEHSAQAGPRDRQHVHDSVAGGDPVRPGPTNGFWRDADWLGCRDGKWRPVEPGTFPLAHGAASRVGRLRAYGNAINAQAAKAFCEILMECAP